MYCQKAFVQVCVCVHCFLIASWCWVLGGVPAFYFLLKSFPGQVPFGLSGLFYSWLLCSCCASRTAALCTENSLIIICSLLVEKVVVVFFFPCLLLANFLFLPGAEDCITKCSAMKLKHLNPLFLLFDRFVLQTTAVEQIKFPPGLSF